MKTPFALILSAALLALAGCDQMQTSQTAGESAGTAADIPAAPAGKVLATVNGSAITQAVVDVYMEIRKNQSPGKPVDEVTVLEELISMELMRQEGIENGLDTQPAVIATLEHQQRTVLASAAIKDFLANNPVTDEEAKEIYDNQIGKGGKEYNARHILVETREEATEIIQQLDEGGNFEELAKEKSTGPSGKTGGKLGWFSPAQMVKPFSDATAVLEKGTYTKEPVQTQFGWHVILLEDSREITPPPFEDLKERLKLLAANQRLQAHIQQLRQSASIEITAAAAGAAPADEASTAEEPAAEDASSEESSSGAGDATPEE
jgi:peptidyl-prolyl cis-trans isomerase C